MQFYFIRHAQSVNNLRWDQTGSDQGRSEDPELTYTGRRQADLFAEMVSRIKDSTLIQGKVWANRMGLGLTHIYTSLHLRSVSTAAPLASALGLPLVAWQDWHEHGGIYLLNELTGNLEGRAGRDRAFFEAHFPSLVLPTGQSDLGWWNRPREKEEEHLPRARRVLAELLESHGGSDDHVAVVSHGGFYNDFIAAVFGLERRPEVWLTMNNVAITRIDFNDHRVNLIYHNRIDYLPDELIT
jgi:2,3-bisphosphoglycerate-dependent phosphoglycerate mutase